MLCLRRATAKKMKERFWIGESKKVTRRLRIQVCRRRFRVEVGNSFLGVWERRGKWDVYRPEPEVAFVIPLPEEFDRKKIRAEILKRISV